MTDKLDNLKPIIEKYRLWIIGKDDGYIYDEIHDFVGDLSRGELLHLFETIDQCIGDKE